MLLNRKIHHWQWNFSFFIIGNVFLRVSFSLNSFTAPHAPPLLRISYSVFEHLTGDMKKKHQSY